ILAPQIVQQQIGVKVDWLIFHRLTLDGRSLPEFRDEHRGLGRVGRQMALRAAHRGEQALAVRIPAARSIRGQVVHKVVHSDHLRAVIVRLTRGGAVGWNGITLWQILVWGNRVGNAEFVLQCQGVDEEQIGNLGLESEMTYPQVAILVGDYVRYAHHPERLRNSLLQNHAIIDLVDQTHSKQRGRLVGNPNGGVHRDYFAVENAASSETLDRLWLEKNPPF